MIENLLDKANRLVIGGGMVFTFLKAKGYEVGTSLLEEDQLDKVKGLHRYRREERRRARAADRRGRQRRLPGR